MRIYFLTFLILFHLISCSNKEQILPCNKPLVQLSISPDTGCATGSVQILSVNTNPDLVISTLRKNGKGRIVGIPAGKHLLTIIFSENCSVDTLIEINSIETGPLFKNIQEILRTNCASCHSGLNPHAGHDFTDICSIVQLSSRIKQRAVLGNPSPMPPSGLISNKDREELRRWIDAGARIRL